MKHSYPAELCCGRFPAALAQARQPEHVEGAGMSAYPADHGA